MKPRLVLTSSFIAGALLLLGTGCASDAGKDTEASPGPSSVSSSAPASPEGTSTPSASASATIAATPEEQKAEVVKVAQAFYDTILDTAIIDKLKASGSKVNGQAAEPTDADIQQIAAENPEAFKHFDTSTPANIKNAYIQLVMGSSIVSMGEPGALTFEVTPEAVTLNEDGTATINPTHVKVNLNGTWMNDPATTEVIAAPEESKVKVVKQDGKWVMVALDLAKAQEAVSGKTGPVEFTPGDGVETVESAPAQ